MDKGLALVSGARSKAKLAQAPILSAYMSSDNARQQRRHGSRCKEKEEVGLARDRLRVSIPVVAGDDPFHCFGATLSPMFSRAATVQLLIVLVSSCVRCMLCEHLQLP